MLRSKLSSWHTSNNLVGKVLVLCDGIVGNGGSDSNVNTAQTMYIPARSTQLSHSKTLSNGPKKKKKLEETKSKRKVLWKPRVS